MIIVDSQDPEKLPKMEEKNIGSIDILPRILQDSKQRNAKNKIKTLSDHKLVTLTDETILKEDEKKFQDYFLKEKNKIVVVNPVTPDFELSLNKELIEQRQEKLIENEEWVPAYQIPEEKYLKNGKTKRPRPESNKMTDSIVGNFQSVLGGWFKSSNVLIGLKGGADHTRTVSTSEVQ